MAALEVGASLRGGGIECCPSAGEQVGAVHTHGGEHDVELTPRIWV